MSDMAGIKGKNGKFVEKFEGGTERISARIPKAQADELRQMCEGDEKISDQVRKAIASYLTPDTQKIDQLIELLQQIPTDPEKWDKSTKGEIQRKVKEAIWLAVRIKEDMEQTPKL